MRKTRVMRLIIAIIGFLIAGCAVGPNFQRPEVMLAPKWMDASDKRLIGKSGDYRQWWQSFQDPILDNLIDKAYRGNLSLKIAAMRVLQARAALGIADSELFPQSAALTTSFQRERTSGNSGLANAGKTSNQLELAGSAIWELDFWGKFRRQIQSAKASWLASTADYDNVLVSLTADTANLYINIRTLENRLRIASENVLTQKESLKITEARFQFGTATELDVAQAKTILNNTLALIPALEIQLRQNKNALSVLLGMAPSDLADLLKGKTEIPASPTEIFTGIPADLLRRRPDIRSAEYQAMAQCYQIGVAKSDLYPAFTLNGTLGFSATDIGPAKISKIFQAKSRTYSFGPSVEWNILNYGTIINNVRLEDARFQELLFNYKNTVLAAQREVEDNLVDFLKSQERAGLLAESVAMAKKALGLAVKQYQEGSRDFTAVLITQQALLNEQDNLAVALGEIGNSTIGIYRALGGGWEIRERSGIVSADIANEMAKRTDWGDLLKSVSINAS